MRISPVKLAGLAIVLAGATATDNALAGDVTVTTATTTPLQTSSPDGVSPGNVTVNSGGGQITVTAGQSAITLNSNNNVTNNGTLASNNANDTTGIRIVGGNSGTVTNSGTISLLEDFTMTDADGDGDLDGGFATGSNRIGIFLQGGPAFTGNITSTTGAISVEGNNSAGIRLDSRLIGTLSSSGVIAVTGANSQGIVVNGGAVSGVSGDVIVRGDIAVRGENSTGILVNGQIDGQLLVNSAVSVSGYHVVARPTNPTVIERLDADDTLLSGSAISVNSSVLGGVLIAGIGVEDDEDDDGDGVTEAAGDTNDDATAAINVASSAPAISVATNGANIVLGTTGYGFRNRGGISATGIYDGIDATAVRLIGAGGNTITTAGGILNDGTVQVAAFEADAIGFHLGAGVSAPEVVNRRAVSVRSTSDTDQVAQAFYFAAGSNVPVFRNTGVVGAEVYGEIGDATAIIDRSNTLATITNSGIIQAQVVGTDSDLTDDVFPVVTGEAIAIDVSTSTIGVTLNQIPDTPFTDDDSTDNDVASRPPVRIAGDVLFGSGADTINLLAGNMFGDVSFGAGADSLVINGGGRLAGRVTDSDGALTINVVNGSLGLAGGTLNLTSAQFGANSELAVLLSTVPGESTHLISSGAISFDAGAIVTPVIPGGLPDSGVNVFLTALGGLNGASNVTRVITGVGAPWLYNLSIDLAPGDANSLAASYVIKTASELNFDVNQTAAYAPILEALRQDDTASAAFAGLITEYTFFDAYEDLLPDYSSAAAELAATAIQQGQSATSNRMATTRLRDLDHVSVWAQEIGYSVNRDPENFGVEYRGHGFGLAIGIDGPLENGNLFGLSASFISSEVEEPGRTDGQIAASFGQGSAYYGTALGPIDIDVIAGAGVGKMTSERYVTIGENFEAVSEAEWWAYEGHGAIRASSPSEMGWLVVTPYAALSYVALAEQAYTEEGGGAALDLDVDDTVSQRLWADAGLSLGTNFEFNDGGQISPYITAGYRANVIDEAAERTMRFASGSQDFTLIDETNGSGGPILGLGVDATNGYSTFSIAYEGEFGDTLQRHSLNMALRFRF